MVRTRKTIRPSWCHNGWDEYLDELKHPANLRLRYDLMRKIVKIINRKRWTQSEAAQHCGISQPRMNRLLNGYVSSFSLDALVNIATKLGHYVRIRLDYPDDYRNAKRFTLW